MKLDPLLHTDRERAALTPREEHIQATIAAAQAAYVQSEAALPLSQRQFLESQLRLIHKRWWLAQSLLLAVLWWLLPQMSDALSLARSLGVGATLFVILLIPELAKNHTHHALEIEGTTRFALRHIYAARMLLFGLVDTGLLTLFCGLSAWALQLQLSLLLVHFLLPLTVTACLCFAILSEARGGGLAAICSCLLWGGLWGLLQWHDALYARLALPVWGALFALSLVLLGGCIHRWITSSAQLWEVNRYDISYE